MHAVSRFLPSLVLAALLGASAPAQSLTTLFAWDNGRSPGCTVFFDINVTNPAGMRITSFDVNVSEAASTPFTIDVYVTPNTYVGNDLTPGVWVKVASGSGLTAGVNNPSPADTNDFLLPAGSHGIAIYYPNTNVRYTNGTGSNQMYSNNDATLTLGIARSTLFGGTLFNPRVWNGTIHYANVGTASYGVFGAGCQGSNGVPSLAAASGSLPKIGSTLTLDLTSMRASGGAVVVILGTRNDMPVDLSGVGMPGCTLHTNLLLLFPIANVGGSASLPLPVPNDTSLLGALFYNQALVLDTGVNAFGGVMTNGGEGIIGM
jgi:hypothetical protein